jgi:(2R)-ethylmalonyl-CoA mutase
MHRGDMATLLDGIPLGEMNTSMTINATAAWLLALYIVAGRGAGRRRDALQGTTQNDIIKEYLSRGTYAFPPGPSMRLIADMVAYTVEHVPRWNPVNVCSYHLQEAGATPVQEIAYSMATAIAVLDAVASAWPRTAWARCSGASLLRQRRRAVRRGAREAARDGVLWEELGRRYGVATREQRRFRYGVQVNSLGLTESQPENNVQRIVLEALAVTLGRSARARRCSFPPGTRRLGCRGRGTSSGRCGSSRCSRTRPTCSTTRTSSRARS